MAIIASGSGVGDQPTGLKRIVWLDDAFRDATSFRQIREYLQAKIQDGIVITCASVEGFLDVVREDVPDLAIIDFRLESAVAAGGRVDRRGGIEAAQEMAASVGSIPVLFLSEYTGYSPANRLDPAVPYDVLLKPHTIGQAWEGFDQFVDELESALDGAQPVGVRPSSPPRSSRFFALSPEDYGRLALDEQLALRREAITECWDELAEIFARTDAEWLVTLGESLILVRWGDLDDEYPDAAELEIVQATWGTVPLLVSRPVEVGVIGETGGCEWLACSYTADRSLRQVDRIPGIQLSLAGQLTSFHLDTGSVVSFIDYDYFVEKAVVAKLGNSLSWWPMQLSIGPGGRPNLVDYSLPKLNDVEAAALDGYESIHFRPRAVRGWLNTALARLCPGGKCDRSVEVPGKGYWCGRRRGLIGRDLLRLNSDIAIVMDAETQRTFVLRRAAGDLAGFESEDW